VSVVSLRSLFSHWSKTPAAAAPKEIHTELSIVCVGDVMVHEPQLRAQYDSKTGTYNFDNNFQYIKKYIEAADLAICNIETTFAGPSYSGYPAFSSPDELAASLKNAGFDIASTANNHMLDKGVVGLKRTLDVLWGNGFGTTGSLMEATDLRYTMKEVNGVQIAVIGYTYETPSIDSRVAINGSYISPETAAHINSFGYEDMDAELSKIQDVVTEAKVAGADIVIMFYHWGTEYHTSANQYQRYMAEKTAQNMDVDIIFGSHPHNLQEMEYYPKTIMVVDQAGEPVLNEETGKQLMSTKQVPVFFSLGNFLSNQRRETLGAGYHNTETGAIGRISLEYVQTEQEDGTLVGEIATLSMDAIPTWVDKYKSNGKDVYVIVPLDEDLDSNETLAVSGHLSRAQAALGDAHGILGTN